MIIHLDIPDILRPKNVEELNSAIEYFEQNDSERIKLVQKLQKLQNKYIRKEDVYYNYLKQDNWNETLTEHKDLKSQYSLDLG